MSNLITSQAWLDLQQHSQGVADAHLRQLFAADPARFSRLSLKTAGILLDISKQRLLPETLPLLHQLWQAADGPHWLQRLRHGETINHTEHRAVLHHALRYRGNDSIYCEGRDVVPEVRQVLAQMAAFSASVHNGTWRGASGLRIRNIVNIGIGGSDLGPKMAVAALSSFAMPDVRSYFLSNVDGAHLSTTLAELNPAETLFVVVSKTFTTQETLLNARSARHWLVSALGESAVSKHFVAVSANQPEVELFGIAPENMFVFWDWVGGRFSLWSSVGLSIALALGYDNFRALLDGAADMDEHFFGASPASNLPLTLALVEFWNTAILGCPSRAVLPYSESLKHFSRFLQQLEMESNGKRINRSGQPVPWPTAPIVWGEPGTNGQHAFYQMLHQGGAQVPCDFIAFKQADYPLPGHHSKLLANCLAQSEAMMRGKTQPEAAAEMLAAGMDANEAAMLAPYRSFPGNQPSLTLLLDTLTPHSLGQLIALYEHKVFALGVLWDINSYDQWGVEYGKQLASRLLPIIEDHGPTDALDSSTAGLIAALRS